MYANYQQLRSTTETEAATRWQH